MKLAILYKVISLMSLNKKRKLIINNIYVFFASFFNGKKKGNVFDIYL